MRDPARIDEFCEQLKRTWHQFPDWRFGQLIANIFCISENPEFFYIEDDRALDFLKAQETPMSEEEAEEFWNTANRLWQRRM